MQTCNGRNAYTCTEHIIIGIASTLAKDENIGNLREPPLGLAITQAPARVCIKL